LTFAIQQSLFAPPRAPKVKRPALDSVALVVPRRAAANLIAICAADAGEGNQADRPTPFELLAY
jgi:hypothetical protein